MTAHPKIDPVTGEMLFFGLRPASDRRTCASTSSTHSGKLVLSKEIEIPGPSMMHDFAITERHVVFLDLPVVFDLRLLSQPAVPREVDARVRGTGRRHAAGRERRSTWFEVEPCYVFHTVNAYDDGDTVVLDVVRHAEMFTEDIYGIGDGTGTLDRWTIDLGCRSTSGSSGSMTARRSSLASTSGSSVARIATGTRPRHD